MADAISYNESYPGEFHIVNTRPGGGSLDGVNLYARYSEHRPATNHGTKSSSGWRPPLPWSHQKSVTVEPFIHGAANNYWQSTIDGNATNLFSNYFETYPSVGTHEDLAVNSALLNLSNQKTDFGQNFAEHQQVADLAAGNAENIARSIRDYKHRNPNDWRKVKKLTYFGKKGFGAIPNSWLQLQYGWIPLLLDVKGAFDVMKSVDSDGVSMRYSAKGRSSAKSRVRTSPTYIWPGPGMSFQFGKASLMIEDTVGCFVRLDFYMDNPMLHEAQQIGLVNPVQLAWNLIPYSFVVDWFLPVGNYLQSWTAPLGLSFLGGSISTLRKRKITLDSFESDPGMYWGQCDGGRADNFSFNRVVLSNFPGPRMPHFKNPLSLHHFANAMSLLVNALR